MADPSRYHDRLLWRGAAVSLSDAKVRNLKAGAKAVKHSDGSGLYLLVTTAGARSWRWNYVFAAKQKTIVYGLYPDVSLIDARDRHRLARQLLASGVDPLAKQQATEAALVARDRHTFRAIAQEWFDSTKHQWVASHTDRQWQRLERNVLPWLGDRPISEITSAELLAPLKRVESRGSRDTAKRVLQICGQIFRFAIASSYITHDPTPALRGALASPIESHLAALTDPKDVAEYLRAIDNYKGFQATKSALQFGVLTFVRPGELRHAAWSEINFDEAMWSLPAEKMKSGLPHLVPLSRQAVAVLRELQPLTGTSPFVFPSLRDFHKPMSNGAVLMALRRMGYRSDQMTGHGVRAMARTILDEVLGEYPHVIEQQLAHAVGETLGRAYNRTRHLPQRRELMQKWADYLDGLRVGNVVPFPKAVAS